MKLKFITLSKKFMQDSCVAEKCKTVLNKHWYISSGLILHSMKPSLNPPWSFFRAVKISDATSSSLPTSPLLPSLRNAYWHPSPMVIIIDEAPALNATPPIDVSLSSTHILAKPLLFYDASLFHITARGKLFISQFKQSDILNNSTTILLRMILYIYIYYTVL